MILSGSRISQITLKRRDPSVDLQICDKLNFFTFAKKRFIFLYYMIILIIFCIILFVNNSYKYIYIDLIMIVCKNNYGFCLNIRKLIFLLYILCDEIRHF